MEDVAARGAVAASSAADVAAHGANMAVDGNSNTFWVGWMMGVLVGFACAAYLYTPVLVGQRLGCRGARRDDS